MNLHTSHPVRRATRFHQPDMGDSASGGAAGAYSSGGSAAAQSSGSAASSPGAGGISESAAGFIDGRGTFAEGWTERLSSELGDARAGFAKFRSIDDLAKSYRGLEQRLGKSAGAVYVPGEGATPEEVSAYRRALGVPEQPDGYQLRPDDLPEGFQWDDAQGSEAAQIAHKYNVPPAAMKELVNIQMQREMSRVAAMEGTIHEHLAAGERHLQETWGDKFGQNINRAQQMAQMVGIDPRSSGFTDPEVVKAFARFSELISDDKFVAPGATPALSSAESAKDIMTNRANPLYEKYQNGDPDTVERVRGMLRRG